MRLLCINDGWIRLPMGNYAMGTGLEKGKEYTTEYYVTHQGDPCFFIEELKEPKLCVRFKILYDELPKEPEPQEEPIEETI